MKMLVSLYMIPICFSSTTITFLIQTCLSTSTSSKNFKIIILLQNGNDSLTPVNIFAKTFLHYFAIFFIQLILLMLYKTSVSPTL